MNELQELLLQIEETCETECHGPFPYADVRALTHVFEDEFDRLGPEMSLNADLNLFCCTIHGWACGGIRQDLSDAGRRYRAKVWLSQRFFDRFPMYRFLERYDLSEYAALHHLIETKERLRQMLLDAIHLYEIGRT